MKLIKNGSWVVVGKAKTQDQKKLVKYSETIKKQYALNTIKCLLELGEISEKDYNDIKYKLLRKGGKKNV